MAPKKTAAASPKAASKVPAELVSGLYPLANFRIVVTTLVKMGNLAKITVPYSWAKEGLPILSPPALRLIDIQIGTDKELGDNFKLDLKRTRA